MNLRTATETADRVARATKASDAGVALTVQTGNNDILYVIWAIGTDGKITNHKLDALCTDEQRLSAHVYGFIANHNKAFAIKEAEDRAADAYKAAQRMQALVALEADKLVAEELTKGVANLLVQQLEWLMHARRIAQ